MEANETPKKDLMDMALKHYEEASFAVHHWNSDIPKAIRAYYKEEKPMTFHSCKHIEKYRFIDRDGELRCSDCHKVISKKDQEIFFNELINPSKPNKTLRSAASRYKKLITRGYQPTDDLDTSNPPQENKKPDLKELEKRLDESLNSETKESLNEFLNQPPEFSERDWTEDFKHENGNYVCKCYMCKQYFYGHKRRPECKVCSEQQKERIGGNTVSGDISPSNKLIPIEVLKKHLINAKWGDADELEKELNENKDQVEAIIKAMKEYNQINLVDFTDWLKWALFHNPDEDDSQTLVNEYLKHNS